MADSRLNVNPTGCPGPIPGTKIWRCDGLNCVYGPNYYASCKEEIAKRGYTLHITSDLTQEVAEASELLRQSVQAALERERKERLDEQYTFAAELEQSEFKQELAKAQQQYLMQQYIKQLVENEASNEQIAEAIGITAQCIDEIAFLKKVIKEQNEKTVTDTNTVSSDNSSDLLNSSEFHQLSIEELLGEE